MQSFAGERYGRHYTIHTHFVRRSNNRRDARSLAFAQSTLKSVWRNSRLLYFALDRVTQTSDRMQEMINSAMQVALAQVTIRQNEVVKRLAGWGAILSVPTMIFSWYGMNFNFMPELE